MGNDLFSIEKLDQAYRSCRRNKRATINALRFELKLIDNLYELREELVNRTYHPTTSICFVQKRPKLREIFAADFRDRVIHHLLVSYLEPIFERKFIHDSYACRKSRGVHAAVTRLRPFLDRVTQNGTCRAWYLKEDIAGFFMNIDKQLLYELICRRVAREDVQWLAHTIIFHDCTKDYHFKGNRSLLQHIPAHKTLFCVAEGKGLPIGNLTSQFFANVYLNELDQFIKRKLSCRYYIRYCDDFLLLDRSPERLLEWRDRIEHFVNERLFLQLNHSQHRLRPVASGIDFLGYIVRRRYVLVRKRVVNHLQEKLDQFAVQLREPKVPRRHPAVRPKLVSQAPVTSWNYPAQTMDCLRATLASYLGHFKWADSFRLVRALWKRYPLLDAAFLLRDGRLIPRYESLRLVAAGNARRCRKAVTLRQAYRWWVPPACRPVDPPGKEVLRPLWVRNGEHPKVLIFFQVGRFYEFYDTQAQAAHSALGLKLVTGLRGFRCGCGFHRRWLGRFIDLALKRGYRVALIRTKRRADGSVERRLSKWFIQRQGRLASAC